jgi:hypothetical protein
LFSQRCDRVAVSIEKHEHRKVEAVRRPEIAGEERDEAESTRHVDTEQQSSTFAPVEENWAVKAFVEEN